VIDPDLIAHIHDIALGRATWEDALVRLRADFATEDAMLVVYGSAPEETRNLSRSRSDGRPWQEYAEHFAAIDPYAAAMRDGRLPEGIVMSGDSVVPARDFCASEYYNDWFRPNGIRHTAGAFMRKPDGLYLQLGLPRAPAAGAYSDEEIVQLQRYFNHIARAVLIQDALAGARAQPDFDRLARTYGLTPAEARLAECLTQSGSLKRIAAHSQRSYYTLRSQLRTIFEKTGTHSQPELIRLIHQGSTGGEPDRADI
jgi:DNA-binding CsgD family transcriptional regulator